MPSYVNALRRLADGYRRAEQEIVRNYFRKPRGRREHIRWLKAQGFKEHAAIRPLLNILGVLHGRIDREIGRREFEGIAEKLAEETKHARLVMDLIEEIGGRRIKPRDLVWLPEDKKLARVRARYSKTFAALLHGSKAPSEKEMRRQDEEIERAAVTLTEGGGGALYEVCIGLRKGAAEKKIASAFKAIHADEKDHKNAGARRLAGLLRTERDYERAAEIVCEVSAQRLRMRNEQFGFPLSDAELQEVERCCRRPSRAAETDGRARRNVTSRRRR
ncbi:MAG TPA: hypothetical protein VGH16_02490 [Candidatus Binatia bacterium]|jgi:hypothetical protein